MKRLVLFGGLLIVGGFSLAVVAIAEPLLMILRPPVHTPRAEDLDWGPDDRGIDIDAE